ncbi:MAG: O-antigen ligase family protein [Aggregatilineales bacterium]
MTYIFSFGTTFSGVILPDLKFFNLAILTIVVAIWGLVHWRSRWIWHSTPLDLLFGLWIVVIGISILTNQDSWRRSLIAVWYVGLYILLWYGVSDALSNKRLNRDTLIDGLLFAGLIVIGFGYLQLSSQTFDLASLNFPRPGSLIGNPNSLGAFLIVIIAFAGGRWVNIKNRLAKIVLADYTVAALCLLFLTFSRGAWIGGAVTLIGLAVLTLRRNGLLSLTSLREWWDKQTCNRRLLISSVSLAGVGVFLLLGILFAQSLSLSGRSVNLRTRIWDHALTMFTDKPITGYGLFNFGREFERLDSMPPNQPHSHAHNAVLLVAAELGVLGLIIMSLTVFVALKVMDSNWRDASTKDQAAYTGAYTAVIGFGVHHLLDTPFMMPLIALAGLLALVIAITPVSAPRLQPNWRLRGHPIGMGILAILVLVSGFWSTDVSRIYTNSLTYVNDGDFLGAATLMQNAIDADPNLAVYQEQQAYLYGVVALDGDTIALTRAIAGYERFLEVEPQSAVGWANYAALLWQNDSRENAVVAMTNAFEASPNSWQLALNLGASLEASGQEESAREIYDLWIAPRNVLLPFWTETPLRQEIATTVEISPLDRYLMGDETVTFDSLNLSGNAPKVEFARLVNLLRQDANDSQIDAQLNAMDRAILIEANQIWLDVAHAEILRARGEITAADAALNVARERLAFDVADADYEFGTNIGNFQFLRIVVPRRFLPQVYYPVVDPLLLFILED